MIPRMKTLLAAAALVLLAGCTNALQTYDEAADQGAEALAGLADRKMTKDLWSLCEAQSVGALRRRFGGDPDGMAAYNALCATRNSGDIVLTEEVSP